MNRLQKALFTLAGGLLVLTAILVSLMSGQRMAGSLTAQRVEVDRQIGRSVTAVIQKALNHGVPFERLVEAGGYLDLVRASHPGMQYLIIADQSGRILHSSNLDHVRDRAGLERGIAGWKAADLPAQLGPYTNIAFPITAEHGQVGSLHVGQPGNMLRELLWDIAYDVLTVLVVASIVAFGLLRLLLNLSLWIPLGTLEELLRETTRGNFTHYLPRDFFGGITSLNERINRVIASLNAKAASWPGGTLGVLPAYRFHQPGLRETVSVNAVDHIQWPFFLLIFADSLSLSFFPLFIGQFYDPAFGVSKEVLIGVPISVFMLVWAFSMPWAGGWCDRVGYRRAFSVGAAVTTIGLLFTAFADSLLEVIFWRSVTAVGYGTVFVTAQAYISAHTPAAERTAGMARFLVSFFAGSLCGAAIGGILVDRLGFQTTFALSAVLGVAAGLFVLRFVRRDSGRLAPGKKLQVNDLHELIADRQFATVTFLAAVPAKIVLTGFLYYSVPLYLTELGNSQSGTGRIMMAYGLAIILFSPSIAALADRFGHRRWFVVLGGYFAAAGVAALWFLDNTFGVVLSVTCIGIAHAIGVPPQLALISESCADVVQRIGKATSTGIFRLVERVGNVLGPLVFGLLTAWFGFNGAFGGIAVLLFIVTTVFALLLLWFDRLAAAAST